MCACHSFSSLVYPLTLGDKDAFAFAFALAGKLHDLHYVAVPPGAAFSKEVSVNSLSQHVGFGSCVKYTHCAHVYQRPELVCTCTHRRLSPGTSERWCRCGWLCNKVLHCKVAV